MQEYAIIVAGGSGSRMKSDIPKQFLEVNGLPILFYTLRAFRHYSEELHIILVLPAGQFPLWQELCTKHQLNIDYQLIAGGETRFHSVRNGLHAIKGQDGIVAVHDGVRPVISSDIISSGFKKAAQSGTAVTSVDLKDSIRIVNKDNTNTAQDRSIFRLIQTPQTFRLDWMREAFSAPYQPQFTDCASVLEAAGYHIHLIDGSYENIKVTTPEDLQWAGIYLGADQIGVKNKV
ncbi:2-C-methyl-D-erythritol 4-phosphate cytidylyltransferase [Dyadobacter sp. CECT 9275]|uniref:2-C-methyl-D-erythritol 4-phosphate cytidylyltransferase n=1 Tax=Dyadobacter helix TaxID=2822344 RepID=A0A916J9T3_9BACT|nr:2-C-methyl-D-erythritol 4-phosphate cytidylyltransferase [Dyadobacter sp. CECT 9275]CAG4989534.1 2-C-methyl-D-erythritol 4-phosphate cytidylyltransferase [Dyadobacter sp. CECT 9275]